MVWLRQSTDKNKVIILEEIQLEKVRELRLRYYIIGEPRMRGKWVFGQFATLIPHDDFHKILKLAQKHGIIKNCDSKNVPMKNYAKMV